MSVPTATPVTVLPVFLIMYLEIPARVPADIVVRLLDRCWEEIEIEPRGQRRCSVLSGDDGPIDIGRGLQSFFYREKDRPIDTADRRV